jgi:hypothetical protein
MWWHRRTTASGDGKKARDEQDRREAGAEPGGSQPGGSKQGGSEQDPRQTRSEDPRFLWWTDDFELHEATEDPDEPDDARRLCELHRMDDDGQLSALEQLLEARGIVADVWPADEGGRMLRSSRSSRLMVRCRDLVYARWVAYSAGLDTWPQE